MTSFLPEVKRRVGIRSVATPAEFLEFDASVSETHAGNAEVTDHPVEDGSQITDHVRRAPEELQVNGIVTDDPIVVLRSIRGQPAFAGGDPRERAKEAYFLLKRWKDDGELLSVTTTLRPYFNNMVITALSVARDARTGRVLNANLTLREIVTATTKRAQPATPKPEKTQKTQQQDNGRKEKAQVQEGSGTGKLLEDTFNSFSGLFGG